MKKIFLCGQTGGINRGCEAIVRSTVKVLGGRTGDINIATFSPWQDREMCRELGINMIPYNSYPTPIHRYASAGLRKLNKNSLAGQGIIQKPLFSQIEKGDICLNIGGDTYCYGRPVPSLALNKYTSKNGIDNILWCCSVEKDNIKGEILEDLKRYKYIFARDPITYESLITAGIPEENVVKCCDPAFFLNMQEVPFPDGFVSGNTVGINVSEMTIKPETPYAYANVMAVIRHILDNTDMSVCLVPHVYSIEENRNDYPILKKIYDEVNDSRVSIVDKEYNCEQLKYIISNCRFFIGARTHSTIAAYSTEVPTLVIGYSVKSKGIAIDLFGTYDGYVIPYTELTEKNELLEAFKVIIEKEDEIRKRLKEFLPEYRKSLSENVKKYIMKEEQEEKPFTICSKNICSGCGACDQKCPKNAIKMQPDSEGFLYPIIDFEKCINCGICRNICPVANKYKETQKEPTAYAAVNLNENIRKNSSSGGMFTYFAEKIIAENGVVFGAGYDENMDVVHKYCETVDGLQELRGSKYVQSRIGNSYKIAKNFLENGRKVLFTGTACQIGGLFAYLGKEYENLYTIDFICHGVPSPKIWESYVKEREKVAQSKVKSVSFRDKTEGWQTYSMKFVFENGKEYRQLSGNDMFLKGFIQNLYLRPACSECSFKQLHRQSDITMADFWGVEKMFPEYDDKKGTSLILVHTDKGNRLLKNENDTKLQKVDFNAAVKENLSLLKSTSHSLLRKEFFEKVTKKNVENTVKDFYGNGKKAKIRRIKAKLFNW